jgi:hypothetical protein
MGRHRKQGKRSPPKGADEGPSGGLTRRQLYADAIKLTLEILKIVNWLQLWLTTLR